MKVHAFALALLFAGVGHAQDTISADAVSWQGRQAHMQRTPNGGFELHSPDATRHIPAASWTSQTASPLFDGLFAMAQDDLQRDSVDAIRDDAFDHGKAIACHCFETGEKWHYVWTRDLSYAVDLGLWRLDPDRSRQSLRFKLATAREPSTSQGLYVAQDTGSGGSWPISTDRVVWFLAARHLLDDAAFADDAWKALTATLAQDREYVFDDRMGLYRGETSFLDWREQTYPSWAARDVTFIAESFALSTNVLHYEALRLAAAQAALRNDARAPAFADQARQLKDAINRHFWREDRGLYMSYVGTSAHPVPYEAYDLLGVALAVTSGVADGERARAALANYPAGPAGSPVIWPQRRDTAIYHNRAIWPFVGAYALRAARQLEQPARITHEVQSLMRGAALAASNMENFELASQQVHVDDGVFSGPVVDSPRQLWSVAGYLDMVIEGIFGLQEDGTVVPKLPVALVPQLFGGRDRIRLDSPDRSIVLVRPAQLQGELLIAGTARQEGKVTTITLKAVTRPSSALRLNAAQYSPATPKAAELKREGDGWHVVADGDAWLYVDGLRKGRVREVGVLPRTERQQCVSVTRVDTDGIESLHSATACVPDDQRLALGRSWKADAGGEFALRAEYANDHGPVNTGITAGVQWVDIDCARQSRQRVLLVLPHSEGRQVSTQARFHADAGASCRFTLVEGFNMTYLAHFAHYTGGQGGASGPLNPAPVTQLLIAPLGTNAP